MEDEQREVLLALFPSAQVSTNKLGKRLEIHYDTARKRAQPLIEMGLVNEVEEVVNGNFVRRYSLTEEGREMAHQEAGRRIQELRKEISELEEARETYAEQK